MKDKELAPICLFTYNRLAETKQTVEALKHNKLAEDSELFIFSDGPKNINSKKEVYELRKYLKTISGFKKISIIEQKLNKGLAKSITDGVSDIVNKFNKVIVLEDDIVTSKGFLRYMNESLHYYEKNLNVMQVSAFMFPIESKGLPDTFFYQANTCWGWGTWKSAWCNYNNNSKDLLNNVKNKKISWKDFNSMQGSEFQKQLLKNVKGTMNTWAVKWHTVIKLKGGTVLHPKETYIANIGFMGNGENCNKGEIMGSINNNLNLDVVDADVMDNSLALERLKFYFKYRYSLSQKIKRKIKSYL